MQDTLLSALGTAPIVPLIEADDPAVAIATASALAAGGITVIEVVQRTDRALDCLEAVAQAELGVVVGAGTVLNPSQAETCIERGARVIVSPGIDPDIVATARRHEVEVLPGIMTPSEAQLALRLELDVVKFFPATAAGGADAIRALAAAFRRLRFVPTGGISASNLGSFLALDSVLACGGSWLAPADLMADCAFDRIKTLAHDALAVAASIKPAVTAA